MQRYSLAVGLLLTILTTNAIAQNPPLTIVSWGGAYETSQTEAYFKPFTALTGTPIKSVTYSGGIELLRKQLESNTSDWDLIDLVIADNIEACEAGLLEKIDHSLLPLSPSGVPAAEDFLPGALTPCGVGQVVSATVLAFNDDAFPGPKPSSISDLFDIDTFPGKRGLQKKPIAIMEWALLSYGIPRKDIYDLLSTERGLRLAFARLNRIKEHITWWENGEEPVQLLADGTVVMSSGYNGRFFNAAINQNLPIEIIWEGQLLNFSTWAIPLGAPNKDTALEFIRFATDTQRLADQAAYIAYGPVRRSSAKLVRKHLASDTDIRRHLPTYAPHQQLGIEKDHEWYAKTQGRINKLFSDWLAEP